MLARLRKYQRGMFYCLEVIRMSNLILQEMKPNLLAVNIIDGIPMVSSRDVADIFLKRHDNVLRDISTSLAGLLNSEDSNFGLLNFKESSYKNMQGKKQPEYLLTKDGFALLTMGYTGAKAMHFKVAYINRFNEMEQFIKSRNLARLEYPELTSMIQLVFDNPEFHYYSNEADMINRIVLGMTAKQFRKQHGLDKGESIRDHITAWQAEAIQKLQKVDVGLVATIFEFQKRKEILHTYYQRLKEMPRIGSGPGAA